MLPKIYYILFCFVLFSCSSSLYAQTSEDYSNDTTVTYADSTIEKSYDDDGNEVSETKVVFGDAAIDTALIDVRKLSSDTISKFKKMKDYQYPEIVKQNDGNKNLSFWESFAKTFSSETAGFVIWTIIIVFMVVVIVLFAMDNNIGMLIRRSKATQKPTQHNENFNDIFSIDYNKEIESAMQASNYNLAARLGFLRLLMLLNNKKLIHFGIEKTNFDYQFQLIHTKYYQQFILAANNYEYAWYAGYVLTANQYKQIAKNYDNLEKQLTN